MKNETICCSRECASLLKKANGINCECFICGKPLHREPKQLEKSKHVVCSRNCLNELKRRIYKGEGNHQYGLKGELNSSFKTGERITFWGYRKIYNPDHPFSDYNGYVLEHRLIAEKFLLNDENSILVDDKKYLNPNCEVHHKDFNRLNNDVSNLFIFLNGETHMLYHSMYKKSPLNVHEFMEYYNENIKDTLDNYNWLYEQYIIKRIGYTKIAKNLNISHSTVKNRLIKYNLFKENKIKENTYKHAN